MKSFSIFLLILICLFTIFSIRASAQDSGYVYLVRDSAQLITTNKIIVSKEYVNVLLEPIPGKVTRWTITRTEEVPIVIPVVTLVNNTELTYTGFWEHPSGAWGDISHSSTVGHR